jgi:hypothetical protein
LICLDEDGKTFFWDHESAVDERPCKVADSFDEFLGRLQPSQSESSNTDGIIESESYLDF